MPYCICIPLGPELLFPAGMLAATAIIYMVIRIVKAVTMDDKKVN